VEPQNLSSTLGRVVLVGLKNFLLNYSSSFSLRAQRERSKEKGHLAGASVAHDSEYRITRAWCAPDDAITASDAARPSSLTASTSAARCVHGLKVEITCAEIFVRSKIFQPPSEIFN